MILSSIESGCGATKKYVAEILTDPHYSKAIIRDIIKKSTKELLNTANGMNLTNHDAGRVYLFVYTDLRDKQHKNWICRALWINPNLPELLRPNRLGGKEQLDEFEIDWNSNHKTTHNYYLSITDIKSNYIRKIDEVFNKCEGIKMKADKYLRDYDVGKLQNDHFQRTMEKEEIFARKILDEMGNQKFPPLECAECDQILQLIICGLHNMFIPFANWGKAEWNLDQKLWLVRNAQKGYEEDRSRYLFERRKLR
jgi:hypothetical protein